MTRLPRFAARIGGLRISALVGLLGACGGSPEETLPAPRASAAAVEAQAAQARMIVYSPSQKVDEASLYPLGTPEELGGQVEEGAPELSGRIDYNAGGVVGGIFKATAGRVRIYFPFTEHATILEGEVTITDESGQSHTFKKGDSYLIQQGQVVMWDVKKYVIKSFFNTTR